MSIQQMLLGIGGKEEDVIQARVYQAVSSLTSTEAMPYNEGCNFAQYSDGSFLLSCQGQSWTNVQTNYPNLSAMVITNSDATSIVKSAYNYGVANSSSNSSDYAGCYPKQGNSKDFTIFTQYGYYSSYLGTNRTDWNGRWIMMQDSLSNNLAQLYKWNWAYNGYYMDTRLLWKYSGSGNDYYFIQRDYGSTPTTRTNARWGKMTITSSSISCSHYRYMGGITSNGTDARCFTHDGTNLFIHGLSQEMGSRSTPYIMKVNGSSGGTTWFRAHRDSSQNCYSQGACEVDSSGDVYYVARLRKNNAWQPVIIKLNGSNGNTIWSLEIRDTHECMGSAIIGSTLYLFWGYNNDMYFSAHSTSDGSKTWETKIDFSTGSYWFQQPNGNNMQLDKDNNLMVYFKFADTGSLIHGRGAGLFYGIPSDGTVGNGKIGSVLTYATSNTITLYSYNIPTTGTSFPQSSGSCGVGSFVNESSNSKIAFSQTPDQDLVNINNN